jgi:RHS repeat-associated protein
VGIKPQVDGVKFLAINMPMQPGTNVYVAGIRDEAGNMGYSTNTVVYSVVTNATFLYDEAGCITNIAHLGTGGYSHNLVLAWDIRYRLTNADSGSNVVEYSYDVLNRKVSRTFGTNVEYYVYDGDQIIADVDSSGSLLRSYVWGTGIDNLLSITTYGEETNTYYAIKDHQNTVIALTDSSGSVVETYDYDAYGRTKIYSASGSELTESAYGNRYCYQGRGIDWATGLYYFRARWYNPETGRWLSKDPIGIRGGLNQYEFCGSNPVNFVDPSGLTWSLFGGSPKWSLFGAEPKWKLLGENASGCNDGDKVLEDIRNVIDALQNYSDNHWWAPDFAMELSGIIYMHSGWFKSGLDFKVRSHGRDFIVHGRLMTADAFGNYITGYSAGYADTPGLLGGVYAGGVFWAIKGRNEHWTDRDSRPAIRNGFKQGRRDRIR